MFHPKVRKIILLLSKEVLHLLGFKTYENYNVSHENIITSYSPFLGLTEFFIPQPCKTSLWCSSSSKEAIPHFWIILVLFLLLLLYYLTAILKWRDLLIYKKKSPVSVINPVNKLNWGLVYAHEKSLKNPSVKRNISLQKVSRVEQKKVREEFHF